jgi:hypothetical protein
MGGESPWRPRYRFRRSSPLTHGAWSVNDARHLNRKTSQITISATFQISLRRGLPMTARMFAGLGPATLQLPPGSSTTVRRRGRAGICEGPDGVRPPHSRDRGPRADGLWLDSVPGLARILSSSGRTTSRPEGTRCRSEPPGSVHPAAPEQLLFFAHWDTRPIADGPTSRYDGTGARRHDGASGVAVLLGVADALAAPPGVSVDLCSWRTTACSGRCGRADRPVLRGQPATNPRPPAAVFDMVSDAGLQIFRRYSLLGAPEVVSWSGRSHGRGAQRRFQGSRSTLTDDHVSLQRASIRHRCGRFRLSYWHTPDDTIDKVSARLQMVGRSPWHWSPARSEARS